MALRQLILPVHDYYLLLPQLSYHLCQELTQTVDSKFSSNIDTECVWPTITGRSNRFNISETLTSDFIAILYNYDI